MAKVKTTPFDAADYLKTYDDVALYLETAIEEAFAEGDETVIAAAIGTVARARANMSQLARETDISRDGLYRAFSADGNPTLKTLIPVLKQLGFRLSIARIDKVA